MVFISGYLSIAYFLPKSTQNQTMRTPIMTNKVGNWYNDKDNTNFCRAKNKWNPLLYFIHSWQIYFKL